MSVWEGFCVCAHVCVCVYAIVRMHAFAHLCVFSNFHVFLRESVRLYVCANTEDAHDTSRQAMMRPKEPEVIVSWGGEDWEQSHEYFTVMIDFYTSALTCTSQTLPSVSRRRRRRRRWMRQRSSSWHAEDGAYLWLISFKTYILLRITKFKLILFRLGQQVLCCRFRCRWF